MNIQYYAYILYNSIDGQPFYVGKGSGSRMYQHTRDAKRDTYGKKRSLHCKIISILNEGGQIKYTQINAESESHAFEMEKNLIQKYGRKDIGTGILCNLTDGGEGCSNQCPESVQRRAAKHRGMKRSKESKQRMREAQKTIVEERVAVTGKKRSDESILKQSQTTKGKPWSEKARAAKRRKSTSKPVVAYDAKTGVVIGTWCSVMECSRALKCDNTTVWRICEKTPCIKGGTKGKVYPLKTCHGYTFEYINTIISNH